MSWLMNVLVPPRALDLGHHTHRWTDTWRSSRKDPRIEALCPHHHLHVLR